LRSDEQCVKKKPLSEFQIDRLGSDASYQFEALALGTIFIMKQYLKYSDEGKK
jgi:hypothetical protein